MNTTHTTSLRSTKKTFKLKKKTPFRSPKKRKDGFRDTTETIMVNNGNDQEKDDA